MEKNSTNILLSVQKTVAEEAGCDIKEIGSNDFLHSFITDSLEFVCLIQSFRNNIGPMPDKAASRMNTVQDVVDFYEMSTN